MERLRATNACTRAELIAGREAMGSRWAFSWKVDKFGMVVKANVRLVVKKYSQMTGVDFNERFAPTPSTSIIMLLVPLTTVSEHELFHLDIEQAIVQSPLDEIFKKHPAGCGDDSGGTSKLSKSLHCIK